LINLYDIKEKDDKGKPIHNPLAEGEKKVDEALKCLIEQAKDDMAKSIYSKLYSMMEIWKNVSEGVDVNEKGVAVARGRANGLAMAIDPKYLNDEQKKVLEQVKSYTY